MHIVPEHMLKKFTCPHCETIARQDWINKYNLDSAIYNIYNHRYFTYRKSIIDYEQNSIEEYLKYMKKNAPIDFSTFFPDNLSIATCQSCEESSLWIEGEIVFPNNALVEPPNNDLDDDIKSLYMEASNIFKLSPKGSTALLRLALQKLLIQLGKDGENINNNIKGLVSEGLSTKIQKALDLVRVIGNNAVHPGQINIDDNSDAALKLFKIINIIADDMISKPKEISKIYDDIIPEDSKNQINKRDGN